METNSPSDRTGSTNEHVVSGYPLAADARRDLSGMLACIHIRKTSALINDEFGSRPGD